jgi:hypothetical protein
LSSLFKFGTRPPAPKGPGRRHNRSWSVYLNNGCKLTVACGQQPCGMINPILLICEQPLANIPNSERRMWQPIVVLLLHMSGSLPASHCCDGGIGGNRRHPKGITRCVQPQPDSAQEVGRGYARRAQKTGPRCPLYGFSGCSHARIAPIELDDRELAASWQLRAKTAPKDPDAGTSGIYALPPQAAMRVQTG